MAIAVSVLMFIIAAVLLVNSFSEKGGDWLSNFACAVTAALGVLNIATAIQGFRIATGVALCVYGLVTIFLFGKCCKELGRGGAGIGLGILFTLGSFLLMAWVITFAVLQFALVV